MSELELVRESTGGRHNEGVVALDVGLGATFEEDATDVFRRKRGRGRFMLGGGISTWRLSVGRLDAWRRLDIEDGCFADGNNEAEECVAEWERMFGIGEPWS